MRGLFAADKTVRGAPVPEGWKRVLSEAVHYLFGAYVLGRRANQQREAHHHIFITSLLDLDAIVKRGRHECCTAGGVAHAG